MNDIYKNIEEYNPTKKRKILIVFDDMIADTLNNKKPNPIVTELFVRGRKLNISLAFYNKILFCCTEKRELQQIAFNHSTDINFQDFMNLYKKCTAKCTTLASNNSSHFKKNLLELKKLKNHIVVLIFKI